MVASNGREGSTGCPHHRHFPSLFISKSTASHPGVCQATFRVIPASSLLPSPHMYTCLFLHTTVYWVALALSAAPQCYCSSCGLRGPCPRSGPDSTGLVAHIPVRGHSCGGPAPCWPHSTRCDGGEGGGGGLQGPRTVGGKEETEEGGRQEHKVGGCRIPPPPPEAHAGRAKGHTTGGRGLARWGLW